MFFGFVSWFRECPVFYRLARRKRRFRVCVIVPAAPFFVPGIAKSERNPARQNNKQRIAATGATTFEDGVPGKGARDKSNFQFSGLVSAFSDHLGPMACLPAAGRRCLEIYVERVRKTPAMPITTMNAPMIVATVPTFLFSKSWSWPSDIFIRALSKIGLQQAC
jgi:hypothetical protein